MSTEHKKIVVAITGASGAVFAVRLLDVLVAAGCEVHCAISTAGQAVLLQELGIEVDATRVTLAELLPTAEVYARDARWATLRKLLGDAPLATHQTSAAKHGPFRYFHNQDFFAPMASGSARLDGMVVCPCSGGTLSGIAIGACENLIQRAADVQLKERRKLVLVPREAPLSLIHLDNMRRAVEAGAVVVPASPGWYHGVSSIRDLVDFVVSRICDQLDVPNALMKRWGEA